MPLGHTNLSYYKAKTAHTEMGNHRKAHPGQWLRVGGGHRDRMRPCSVGLCGVMGSPGSGFMSMQGGELLLTNSFVSKVQAKFIKSIGAQRQAPQTSNHPVPSSHASGQR